MASPQIKAVALVQGSRDFRVQAAAIVLTGPTPNNAPPLVTPPADPINPLVPLRRGIYLGNRGVK